MSRAQINLSLFFANLFGLLLSAYLLPYGALWERLSVGSAWICTVMLSAALIIGPLRRAAGRPAPDNIYLRRDLGICSALQGFLHVYAGSVVSMNQTYIQAFVESDLAPWSAIARDELFFWGAMLGFIVSLVYLLLFAISSDRAIRFMGMQRWKKTQKSAHLILWLTVLHGIAFQLLESRYLPLWILAALTLIVFVLQYRGRRRVD
ncbi:MAG: hypothetical protein ACR2QG_00830 [Gammaproteobacteria bacterium]